MAHNIDIKKVKFYCQKICGEVDFSIDEWNKLKEELSNSGLSDKEQQRILFPEVDGCCAEQCFACIAIVGAQRLKTAKL